MQSCHDCQISLLANEEESIYGHCDVTYSASSDTAIQSVNHKLASMLENLWLVTRNVAMIVLFPGTVVVYIPYRLLAPFSIPGLISWSMTQYVAVLFLAIGAFILLRSIWSFAHVGKGTLAPFDEMDGSPERLSTSTSLSTSPMTTVPKRSIPCT